MRLPWSAKVVMVLLALLCVSAQGQTEVGGIAARVDARYNSMQTLEADFTETYAGAGITRSESGTLWIKRPGKMRWEYREPREKLFVSDGKIAWFYIPGEKQARKTPVKQLEDLRSPLAYLLGRTRLEKEFSGLSIAPDAKPEVPGDVVIRGIPRHLGGITQVLMEIAPDSRFERISVTQEDGSTTEFRFTNEKRNITLSDQRFRFAPPPGVESVEAERPGE